MNHEKIHGNSVYRQLAVTLYQEGIHSTNALKTTMAKTRLFLTSRKWGTRFRLFILFNVVCLGSFLFPLFVFTMKRMHITEVAIVEAIFAIVLVAISIAIYLSRKMKRIKLFPGLILLYKSFLALPLLLVLLFVLFPDRPWSVLLAAIAWRTFVIAIVLEDLAWIYRKRRRKVMSGPPVAY